MNYEFIRDTMNHTEKFVYLNKYWCSYPNYKILVEISQNQIQCKSQWHLSTIKITHQKRNVANPLNTPKNKSNIRWFFFHI